MTLEASFEAFGEFAGPVVVKEIRQGLRTRLFLVLLTMLVLGCFALALTGIAAAMSRTTDSGRLTASWMLMLLCILELLVVPLWAFRSMSIERERSLLPLVLLTSLSGREVLVGKARSAVVLGSLLGSVMGPFVVFTYFLNGISLLELGFALLSVAIAHVLTVRAAVGLACLPLTRLGASAMYGVMVALLVLSTLVGFFMVSTTKAASAACICGMCWGFPAFLLATITFEEGSMRINRWPTLESP